MSKPQFTSKQRVRVTKKFSFDMAHALFGYDGPCKNIHGHTYQLMVTLLGEPISDNQDPKDGMVIDFGDLKKIVHEVIIDRYDHALVLNENAHYPHQSEFMQSFEKVHLVSFQPTFENLVSYFASLLFAKFQTPTKLISLRLDETPTSFAEWHLSDNL